VEYATRAVKAINVSFRLCTARGFTEPAVERVNRQDLKGSHMSKKHPGFKAVAAGIQRRQGVSKERANAMLAAGTRKASARAKKANPRLKRVKG